VGGRQDWSAGGLPIEGEKAREPRIGSFARRDVPTARLGDVVGDVARRAESSGFDLAIVVSPGGVVLGILDPKVLVVSSTARAEEVMRPGPSTYRPDVPVQELLDKLVPRHVRRALVATPEGRLLGAFFTDDVPGTS
jgi:CBS domain-containing protein